MSSEVAHATVLGASSHAVWLAVEDDVVVVSARDATRLPNGVEVPLRSTVRPFGKVVQGTTVPIGPTSIGLDRLAVVVVRWWDPRPSLPPMSVEQIGVAVAGLPSSVPGIDTEPLRCALIGVTPQEIIVAARGILGRGPGLTPEGDDVLAGALAATRLFGGAIRAAAAIAALDQVAGQLEAEAARRTTSFSAALIRRAARGDVAAPAGAFVRAIAGRGDIVDTHRDLAHVGHSSGPALAAGIVLGALSLVRRHTTTIGGSL